MSDERERLAAILKDEMPKVQWQENNPNTGMSTHIHTLAYNLPFVERFADLLAPLLLARNVWVGDEEIDGKVARTQRNPPVDKDPGGASPVADRGAEPSEPCPHCHKCRHGLLVRRMTPENRGMKPLPDIPDVWTHPDGTICAPVAIPPEVGEVLDRIEANASSGYAADVRRDVDKLRKMANRIMWFSYEGEPVGRPEESPPEVGALALCYDKATRTIQGDWKKAWAHFNERVRGKASNYGEFTNADWQAAIVLHAAIERLSADLEAEENAHTETVKDVMTATERAIEAEAERDRVIAVLRDLQWDGGHDGRRSWCPHCHALEETGEHKTDCDLAALLAGKDTP